MVHIIFWIYILSLVVTAISIFLSLMLAKKINQKWYKSFILVLSGCGLILLSYTCFFFIFKYGYKVTGLLNRAMIGCVGVISFVFAFALIELAENLREKKFSAPVKGGVIVLAFFSILFFFLYILYPLLIVMLVSLFLMAGYVLCLFLLVLRDWRKLFDNPEKQVVLYFIALSVVLFPVEIVEFSLHKKYIPENTYLPMGILTFSIFCLLISIFNIRNSISYFHSLLISPGKQDYDDVPAGFIETFSITAREQEIIEYIVKGYNYQDISGYLHISKRTVEKHSSNVYKKCGINSRVELMNLLREYQ